MEEGGALFRIQQAMGWATFVLPLVTVIAVLIYPPTAFGLVPLNGVAIWNWRRTLERRNAEVDVTTKPPPNRR